MNKNKTPLILSFILSTILILLMSNCKKENDGDKNSSPSPVPKLTTASASHTTPSSVTCGGNIYYQGTSAVTARGVCWGLEENPDTSGSCTLDGCGTGTFTSYISGLSTNYIYYARAYATNSSGTSYGNQISFIPKPDTTTPTVSIHWLKQWYFDNATSDTLMIDPTYVIEGIISADDESGNIYKTLYLQDNTGGICISVDQSSLFSVFHIGQKVRIFCNDLYMGTYGGLVQIGCIYNNKIGRIPATMISSHIIHVGLPGLPPQPVVVNIAHLPDLNPLTSMLLDINSVTFPEAGLTFVQGGYSYTNRLVADSAGNISGLVVRTSMYAAFSNDTLPAGVGTLRGILAVYNGQYQMIVRDMNDIVNFHPIK